MMTCCHMISLNVWAKVRHQHLYHRHPFTALKSRTATRYYHLVHDKNTFPLLSCCMKMIWKTQATGKEWEMKATNLKKATDCCQVCRRLLNKFNCKTKGEDLQPSPLATKREMKMLYKWRQQHFRNYLVSLQGHESNTQVP